MKLHIISHPRKPRAAHPKSAFGRPLIRSVRCVCVWTKENNIHTAPLKWSHFLRQRTTVYIHVQRAYVHGTVPIKYRALVCA